MLAFFLGKNVSLQGLAQFLTPRQEPEQSEAKTETQIF
jgi:hypothetical protein